MHEPTLQQIAIVEHFRSGTGDLCATARAGSGKSYTLREGVLARPRWQRTMMCAFNKRIAEDLAVKMDRAYGVETKTLHGIGLRAITQAFGRHVEINRWRERELAAAVCGEQELDLVIDAVAAIAQMAKEIAPDEALDVDRLTQIAIDFGHAGDVENDLGWDVGRRAGAAAEVVRRSLDVVDTISFADMLYLPLALKLRPESFDLVCVDEAQDMNLAQLRLAARVRAAGGRFVLCGDDRQAIYSWRGAAPGALARVASALNAKRLSLTVTFRCALAIVAEAQKLVPDIQAAPGAELGIVRETSEAAMILQALPGDFVLSRTNAPLARLCLQMFRQGTRATIAGADIGVGLVKLIRKLSGARVEVGDPMLGLIRGVNAWREREITRAKTASRFGRADQAADQADTILAIADSVDTVPQLVERIERLFADDGGARVVCSTVHRAKGLETDRAWVLSSSFDQITTRTPAEQVEEANLRYVAVTRPRRELVWVTP